MCYAFDLIELDGDDLRRDLLAVRKATLASLLRRAAPGPRFNEHLDEEDGPLVFAPYERRCCSAADCIRPSSFLRSNSARRSAFHSSTVSSDAVRASPGGAQIHSRERISVD
jgi:hypothetical protein